MPLQVLISLSIRISECLSLAHIVEIRINSLSVLFRDGSSSSNFSRKLFEFWVYVNILDHLDCSHGALAVFYFRSKFLYPSMKSVVRTCACAYSLMRILAVFYFRKQISLPINDGSFWNLPLQVRISLTIRISDCLFLAHIVHIRMNSLSVLFRDGCSSSNFSRKLLEFWVYVNILDHLDYSHDALTLFNLKKQIFLHQ